MTSRTVAQKMGIKANWRTHVAGAPDGVFDTLGMPPLQIDPVLKGQFDYVHLFVSTQAAMREEFPRFVPHLAQQGKLWLSWPKARKLGSDLNSTTSSRSGTTAAWSRAPACASTTPGPPSASPTRSPARSTPTVTALCLSSASKNRARLTSSLQTSRPTTARWSERAPVMDRHAERATEGCGIGTSGQPMDGRGASSSVGGRAEGLQAPLRVA